MGCIDASSFHSDSRQHWSPCGGVRGHSCDTTWLAGRLTLLAPGVGSIYLGVQGIHSCGTAFNEQSSRGVSNDMAWGRQYDLRGGHRGFPTLCLEISIQYHRVCSEMLVENLRGSEY